MSTTNGFGAPETTFADPFGDIGGPVDIDAGYRWNVPVVTYGFDKSFLDYFGSNGVTAVKEAIQILNDLPPASQMVLSNYPTQGELVNYVAKAQNLYDLRSMTLALLLEQMGLAQPTRFIYVVRRIDPTFMYLNSPFLDSNLWPAGAISNQIVLRNFDPETLDPTTSLNNQLYTGFLYISVSPDQTLKYVIPLPIPANPLINDFAVADWLWAPSAGYFFNGLTRDDVGGVRYLLSPENIRYETLLRSVHPIEGGLSEHRRRRFVDGAWRPGIDKITFVPQPVNDRSGRFLPASYRFRDIFINDDTVRWQEVERHVIRPDILFSAGDSGENKPFTPFFVRTGTTDWLNNAAFNGHPNGEGPGVIQGPVKIIFQKLGPIIETGNTYDSETYNLGWGSYGSATNAPVAYPAGTLPGNTLFTIRLRFFDTDFSPAVQLTNITWHLQVPIGGTASLQVSSNQSDWTALATATNIGSVTEWYYDASDHPPKHFRVVPQ